MRHWRVVSEHLFHRRDEPVRFGTQERELAGVTQQADQSVADQAGGRVVARHDQLEQRREQLLLGEPRIAVAGLQQGADEIVAGKPLLGIDERVQHRHDHVRGRFRSGVLARRRYGAEHRPELATQCGAIGFRCAEQLANDGERERERE